MRPVLILLMCLALLACAGESGSQGHPPTASIEEADLAVSSDAPVTSAEGSSAEGSSAEGSESTGEETVPDPFATSLPNTPCPDGARVAIAHLAEPELPTWLESAVALRSEDGRHIRIAIANHDLELDSAGRFSAPANGEARFEMDATRTRRGSLTARVLGRPDARNGGLSHARIVTSGPLLTFGVRNIGQVEITSIDETQVCGRIELDDGFARVRGAFVADFVGPLPH